MRRLDIEKIESIRLDQGIPKTEFCRQNGIGVNTYNRLAQNPYAKINDRTILKIAKALDLKPSEILCFMPERDY